jgi:beta-glucosidase
VLFGDTNPSGKLPFTYPQYSNNLVTYDHKFSDEMHVNFKIPEFLPQYEFGHGLSYTTFAYSNLTTTPLDTFAMDDLVQVSVEVENTGPLPGKEVVSLYTRDHVASITPSVRRLRRFEKIHLNAGEKKTVTFELNSEDFSFIGAEDRLVAETGAFSLLVGDQEKIVYLK